MFEQQIDDIIRGLTFTDSSEVQAHAVTQNGMHELSHIGEGGFIPSAETGVGLGCQQQTLSGPRAAAPTHPLIHKVGSLVAVRPRGAGQSGGVVGELRTHLDPPHHFLQSDDRLGVDDLAELRQRFQRGRQ